MGVAGRREIPRPLALAVFGALALVPLAFGDYWAGQATRFVLFGIFAMSLSLVWGRAGILCLGQAMFFGLGGYVFAVLAATLVDAGLLSMSWLALPVAVAVATVGASALGAFLFWGAGISGAYLAVVTLAIAVALESLIRSAYAVGGDNGLAVAVLPPGTVQNPVPLYLAALALAAALYFALDRLLASRFGLVLEAVRTNPERLAFLGYSVPAYRLAAFAIGAALAALAGGLFAAVDSFVSPTLIGFGLSAEVLIWVALGGRHILLAAFLAAMLVRWAEGALSAALGDWWLLVLGGAFMVSVVTLPRGLLATPLLWLADRWPRRRAA